MNVTVLAFKWMEIYPYLESLFRSASGNANERSCSTTLYQELFLSVTLCGWRARPFTLTGRDSGCLRRKCSRTHWEVTEA